jgi:hypothetical protein
MAVSTAKVVETILRSLDLSSAVAIASKPSVGAMQFHRRSLNAESFVKRGIKHHSDHPGISDR